jgi:hypothetical protein
VPQWFWLPRVRDALLFGLTERFRVQVGTAFFLWLVFFDFDPVEVRDGRLRRATRIQGDEAAGGDRLGVDDGDVTDDDQRVGRDAGASVARRFSARRSADEWRGGRDTG